jgi:hypothetical protein
MSIATSVLFAELIGGTIAVARPSVEIPRSPHRMPPERPEGQWLTVMEFAERTGLSQNDVHGLIRKGKLETVMAHRGRIPWRFIRDEDADVGIAA